MKKLLFLSVFAMAFVLTASAQVIKDTIIIRTDKEQHQKKHIIIRSEKAPQKGDSLIIIEDSVVIKMDKPVIRRDSFVFKSDTIRVGNSIIINHTDSSNGRVEKKVVISVDGKDLGNLLEKQIEIFGDKKKAPFSIDKQVEIFSDRKKELKNVENSWFVLDLGFSKYTDNSDYARAAASGMVWTGLRKDNLKVNTLASRNVNIWFLLQRLNLAQHKLNLKYGFGLELNNYRFEQTAVSFQKNPTFITLRPFNEVSKAKLAADYLTIPMMLNFNSTPAKNNGLRLSAGVSAGFLYSARFKTKANGDVMKTKSDFDLEPFKFSWVGELGFGNISLYGNFAMNNMWSKGLDMKPYSIGLRFGAKPDSAKRKKISSKKPASIKLGAKI